MACLLGRNRSKVVTQCGGPFLTVCDLCSGILSTSCLNPSRLTLFHNCEGSLSTRLGKSDNSVRGTIVEEVVARSVIGACHNNVMIAVFPVGVAASDIPSSSGSDIRQAARSTILKKRNET